LKIFPFKTEFRLINGPFKTGFTVFNFSSEYKKTVNIRDYYGLLIHAVGLHQRFSMFFEVGTTVISQNSSADHLTLVRFEVFTAVTMQNIFFWGVAPCGSGFIRRFGGTYRLHLQGRWRARDHS
jgi:hypothetical protein